MAHTLSLDYTAGDTIDTEAWQAYCTCGWTGCWHHNDADPETAGWQEAYQGADNAHTAAVEDGTDHKANLA